MPEEILEKLARCEVIVKEKLAEGKSIAVIEEEMWDEQRLPEIGFDIVLDRLGMEKECYENRLENLAQEVVATGYGEGLVTKEFDVRKNLLKTLEEGRITTYEVEWGEQNLEAIAEIVRQQYKLGDKLYREHLEEENIPYEESELDSGVSVIVNNDGYIMNTNKAIAKDNDNKEFDNKTDEEKGRILAEMGKTIRPEPGALNLVRVTMKECTYNYQISFANGNTARISAVDFENAAEQAKQMAIIFKTTVDGIEKS